MQHFSNESKIKPINPAKLLGNGQISNQTKAEKILNMLEASTKRYFQCNESEKSRRKQKYCSTRRKCCQGGEKRTRIKNWSKSCNKFKCKKGIEMIFSFDNCLFSQCKSFFTAFHNEIYP
jgi:hypothetical protein